MLDCVAKSLNATIGAVRFAAAGINCRCTITNYAASREVIPKKISSPYAIDAISEFTEHNGT